MMGSRILTHILFWLLYYITFSIIWANDGNYYASFGLEFVLMPVRISAAYLTMYFLIPHFLLRNRQWKFMGLLLVTLILAGIFQRVFIYFFHELFFTDQQVELWDIYGIVRAIILVNSTVLLLSAVKMYHYWQEEYLANVHSGEELIEVRAEKRTYRIRPNDILYIEGLGNYVTYYFSNRKPLISYSSLKEVEHSLPSYFERIHKSFIVNTTCIDSYTSENVEVQGRILPVGKSVELKFQQR
ncbi:MAG: LytTR family DNA-binding domain-containing protein [Cyclobacteriaceae bacterium]